MDPRAPHAAPSHDRRRSHADEVFSMLMGDVVAPRKNFIQTHALEVKNLDI